MARAVAVALLTALASADLPVHCVRHQVVGDWKFTLGATSSKRSTCGHRRPDTRWFQPNRSTLAALGETEMLVSLKDPNVAATTSDARGHWTMIYDEGFEVNVGGLSLIAFSNYTYDVDNKTNHSHCDQTMVGWYRNTERTKWGCWYGQQVVATAPAEPKVTHKLYATEPEKNKKYDDLIDLASQTKRVFEMNNKLQLLQVGWRARVVSKWNGRSPRQLNRYAGISRATKSKELHRDMIRQRQQQPRSFLQKPESVSKLPAAWDWSNVSGVDYLEPVMDQSDCGSCYAVSSVRMLSARHKIAIKNASAVPWSISFPLFCSEYNQGCDGGYGFLLSRWSGDVGLLPATCMRYKTAGDCKLECNLEELQGKRWRVANHRYVGSFYGHANEQLMMDELYKTGPLSIGIEPAEDFMYYSDGVYKSEGGKRAPPKEWEQVDHGVLLVGWGEDNGQKYWRVQNSWGPDWGEDGFFRILRGVDESAIESMAEAADVVEDEQRGAGVAELFAQLYGKQ